MYPAPNLDQANFSIRTTMPASDFAIVTTGAPGWFEAKEKGVRELIYARLAKRYVTPMGTTAPPLSASGTSPPAATLSGAPSLGAMALVLAVLVAGPVGGATFQWSQDGGNTWTSSSALASSGTAPPPVTVSGASVLEAPSSLSVQVTAGGTLGAALFQWSQDGGATWSINPVLAATGTTPPAATIAGTSSLALPSDLQVQITGAGALGTAPFRWSLNGGVSWSSGVTASSVPLPGTGLTVTFPAGAYATDNVYAGQGLATAASFPLGTTGLALAFPAGTYTTGDAYTGQGIATASSVPLPGTGLTVTFPAGTYGADNVFSAPTPVPEAVLSWETTILTYECYRKRGVDWTLPTMVQTKEDRDQALAEIKEAADSKDGLFDLPTNDASATSAISQQAPLGCSQHSPYEWVDQQACEAGGPPFSGVTS